MSTNDALFGRYRIGCYDGMTDAIRILKQHIKLLGQDINNLDAYLALKAVQSGLLIKRKEYGVGE